MKHVLLARPSSLIVNDMKKLMNATGMEPLPLRSLTDIVNYTDKEIGGIVVSTALSSPVKEKYWEVIKRVIELFPMKPIFLASYASIKSTKITASARFKEFDIDRNLVGLDEVNEEFSSDKDILILTQSEISDSSKFDQILTLTREILEVDL